MNKWWMGVTRDGNPAARAVRLREKAGHGDHGGAFSGGKGAFIAGPAGEGP